MYYTIYKTTNLLNETYYIGQHKTKNLDDGYLGSGVLLNHCIKLYGKDNFKKEILHIFDNFEDMNNKEIEIVTEEFVADKKTMNLSLGGLLGSLGDPNKIVARLKNSDDKFLYIDREIFINNKELYETPSTGKLIVRSDDNTKWITINNKDYNPNIHVTPPDGRITVSYIATGETKSISKTEFDETLHKSVFGGKVIIDKHGIKRYATEHDDINTPGIHIGKVTVRNKETNIIHHVTKEEYYNNKEKYSHITAGNTYGKHKITGEFATFPTGSVTDEIRKDYAFSTSGQCTVYDVSLGKWRNIPKDDYDPEKYKRTTDLKFKFITPFGEFIHWGSKTDFLKKFNVPRRVWDVCMLQKGIYNNPNSKRGKKYNGSYIIMENW